MPVYPVRVFGCSYRGSNPAKSRKRDNYNRVAAKIEAHLNSELSKLDDGVHVFLSYGIASDIREDPKIVGDIVTGMDGGSHGVTIRKGEPHIKSNQPERH